MADIQHASLTDSFLHEAKGAATATAGQVLTGTGVGTATFQNLPPDPVYTFAIQDTASSFSTANQWLAADGDQAQVVFGTSAVNSPGGHITIGVDGSITFNTTGTYEVESSGIAGRDTGTGVATLHLSARFNGTQIGRTYSISLDDASDTAAAPVANSTIISATAGDVLTYHQLREGGTTGNVGLKPVTVTGTGWNDAASASVSVSKIGNDVS